ncbi:MAG: MarR family transcriptional regulator [Gammaproteobacteria bacterium]|nr:MarR family transcriptional regulator [Gammaproteobacteria bacterium]
MSSRPPSTARPRAASAPRKSSASTFYDGRTYATDNSYGYLLRRLYASMQRHFEKRMQPLDLTAGQWGPLLLMAEGRGNTAAELARGMDIDTGAMTRMLDRLQAKGLVARARSASDRRVVQLELTTEGLKVASQIPHQLADVLNLHLKDFKTDELHMLMGFLQRMIANGATRGAAPVDDDS